MANYVVYNGELYHYGVKGMKWGVRKTQNQAKKDAKEFARAKMFYGEGAGTRRKLIKNTVQERSKDPVYKKAFDDALSKQDMAKHAQKAKSERKRKDAVNQTKKTGRGLVNMATGHPERVGAGLAALAVGVTIAHKTGVDKIITDYAKTTVSKVANGVRTAQARRAVEEILARGVR